MIKNYPDAELSFLDDCATVVKKCRIILKWTYAVRFLYKFTKEEEDAFLFRQSWLEDNTERAH